ncbi:MAG: cytochrome-c peroxidase [Burkholderiales bacterium]
MKKLKLETIPSISPGRIGLIALLLTLTVGGSLLWRHFALPPPSSADSASLEDRSNEVYSFTQPLPLAVPLDAAKVALGNRLFHDPRLSADDTISCANCHNLGAGGADNRARSVGIKGGVGAVNAPTVYNSGLNFVQFWDGRAPTLEAQVDGPVTHPLEMGSTWLQVVAKLHLDASYKDEFSRLYADGLTTANIKNAIAMFEQSLITPNSRFDKFLRGETSALNAKERQGYGLFQSYGCSSCHQGVNLGGNMYEKMGLMGDYFADRGNLTEADNGRFNLTRNPDHLHEFRVPSLRNVAVTAPYFHDGSANTLEEAIEVMVKYQLGRPMSEEDVQSIAAFLRTLTGEYLGKAL